MSHAVPSPITREVAVTATVSSRVLANSEARRSTGITNADPSPRTWNTRREGVSVPGGGRPEPRSSTPPQVAAPVLCWPGAHRPRAAGGSPQTRPASATRRVASSRTAASSLKSITGATISERGGVPLGGSTPATRGYSKVSVAKKLWAPSLSRKSTETLSGFWLIARWTMPAPAGMISVPASPAGMKKFSELCSNAFGVQSEQVVVVDQAALDLAAVGGLYDRGIPFEVDRVVGRQVL